MDRDNTLPVLPHLEEVSIMGMEHVNTSAAVNGGKCKLLAIATWLINHLV